MKPAEGSQFFSLDARRRIEAEKVKLRRAAEARAARVVARLAYERRLRQVHEAVAKAELRALGRLLRGSLSAFWELARTIVARLQSEDRPATFAAADDVGQAIEGEGSGVEQAAALVKMNSTGTRPADGEVA